MKAILRRRFGPPEELQLEEIPRPFNGLRERIPPARTVLITGAAGGVGSFAVQIAKLLGAEVTGVCHRQALDFVRSLGVDHVIATSNGAPTIRTGSTPSAGWPAERRGKKGNEMTPYIGGKSARVAAILALARRE